MPDVTVSILTYNQLGPVKACLASILHGGEEVDYILTSNGNPEVAKYFHEFAKNRPNVRVVVNEQNEGFWAPNNHALSMTETRFFCMVNDDLTVPGGWLNSLKAPMLKYPRSVFSAPDTGCTALNYDFHGTYGPKEYCEGALLLCDTEIVKRHGLFEPLPGKAYGEDSHASLRFRELDYRLHWVPMHAQHLRGATSRTVPEVGRWQAENHAFLKNRWAFYLARRTFDYPIVLKRTGAFGDVLLLTPIIRELKRVKPLSKIYVETVCPEIFDRNPHVERAAAHIGFMPLEMRFNLDGSYESDPMTNFVQTYAKVVGVKPALDQTELYIPPADITWGKEKLGEGRWIGVNCGPTWESKELAFDKWQSVITRLRADGFKIVNVGRPSPKSQVLCDLDLRGHTNVPQLAAIIAECELLICVDSFPMHVAQAVGTPIVPLFGVTLPAPILTSGSIVNPVCADPSHPGAGLRHKIAGSTFTPSASNPMDTITADQVYEAVHSLLKCCLVISASETPSNSITA